MKTTMRHIENFEELILRTFQDIIKEFNLSFKSNSNDFESDVKLIGTKCTIHFLYDRGELSCSLINTQTGRKYLSNLVYKLLYPNDKSFIFSVNDSPELKLGKYAQLIRTKLSNVIEGDFSWSNDYDKIP